jgi:hypothetical protein
MHASMDPAGGSFDDRVLASSGVGPGTSGPTCILKTVPRCDDAVAGIGATRRDRGMTARGAVR